MKSPTPATRPAAVIFTPAAHTPKTAADRKNRPSARIDEKHWVACHFAEELELRGFEAIGSTIDQ